MMEVSEEAQVYNPKDMTHAQPSITLSIEEEAPLNQVPVHK